MLTEWNGKEEEEDQTDNIWEDNWDDDNVEDDFSQQLRLALDTVTGASVHASHLAPCYCNKPFPEPSVNLHRSLSKPVRNSEPSL